MNKEQIIDETYYNYFLKTGNITLETLHVPYQNTHLYGTVSGPISNAKFRPYTQEEFITKCKTDSEFSEKWGLKIEEQELTYSERWFLKYNETFEEWMNKLWEKGEIIIPRCSLSDEWTEQGIPTKLITITYKDTIIESYE